MKFRILFLALSALSFVRPFSMKAQDVVRIDASQQQAEHATIAANDSAAFEQGKAAFEQGGIASSEGDAAFAQSDAANFNLTLPLFDATPGLWTRPWELSGAGFGGFSPWNSGLDSFGWRLHEGFNAQLGMSLSVGFGHGAPHGVGFGRSAAFAYALPLSEKFSAAVGVYTAGMDWGAFRQTDAGVAATLRYQLSDAVSLYAYGSASLLPDSKRRPFAPWAWGGEPKERIGAMAEFRIGEKATFQIAVEQHHY